MDALGELGTIVTASLFFEALDDVVVEALVASFLPISWSAAFLATLALALLATFFPALVLGLIVAFLVPTQLALVAFLPTSEG